MSVSEKATVAVAAGVPDEPAITVAVEKILASFTGEKSGLIPILQQVQQKLGYLPQSAMKRISAFLKVPESTLYGVATFYAQFKFVPTGKNLVRVCRGTACHVKGGERVLKEAERHLGIKEGQSTPDMQYSIETVACIGACALAPNMVVKNKIYGNMNTRKIASILDSYKER
jgi:NADH-quinone oxidoreductase subunit E